MSMKAADDQLEDLTFTFASHLKEHLDSLWKAGGTEDWSLYAPNIQFSDPIQSLGGLEQYKKSLRLLKDSPFSSNVLFETHDVSVSGKGMVRSRWTLSSDVKILPWQPRIVFTGISEYQLNEEGKVCKHVDYVSSSLSCMLINLLQLPSPPFSSPLLSSPLLSSPLLSSPLLSSPLLSSPLLSSPLFSYPLLSSPPYLFTA
eukprot:765766-Hanusia_phi.AAC.2